jgi:chromosome partitioning protein
MTKKITLFNNKGGVGKTTFLFHLGCSLEKMDKRILFVDLDPQCNLTSYIMTDDEIEEKINRESTIYNAVKPLISGEGDYKKITPFKKKDKDIFLITGDIGLSEFEDILSESWTNVLAKKERGFRIVSTINRIIDSIAGENQIDYILIDIGPNLGSLNKTVLLGCDFFFIPVIPDLFSIRGLQNIGKTFVKWINEWKIATNEIKLPFSIQKGKPCFSGYITQNFNIYRKDPTRNWAKWDKIIPEIIDKKIIKPFKNIDNSLIKDLNNGSFLLGDFKNYHSLAPCSQRLNKPIFDLTSKDEGVNSGYNSSIKNCKVEFEDIANKVNRSLK